MRLGRHNRLPRQLLENRAVSGKNNPVCFFVRLEFLITLEYSAHLFTSNPFVNLRAMQRLILLLIGQALCCGVAAAQDHAPTAAGAPGSAPAAVRPSAASKGPGEPSPLAATEPAREIEPSLYYLKDKDGNLLRSPGFKFEDFTLENYTAHPHIKAEISD